MNEHKIKSSKLRQIVLHAYRDFWEKAPAENQYVITQELWSPVWDKWRDKMTPAFASAVLASLDEDRLIENIATPDPTGKTTQLSRITDKGLGYLDELEVAAQTRILAILGAVTGTISLLISLIGLLLKLLTGA